MKRRTKLIILIIFILIIAAFAATEPWRLPTPVVTISSVYNLTKPSTTFLVNITVSDVSNLAYWAINMTWDPKIIKVTTGDPKGLRVGRVRYNIYEGPFIKNATDTYFLCNRIDNTKGTMEFLTEAVKTPGIGVSGSGLLAAINFTYLSAGETALNVNGPSVKQPGQSVLQDAGGGGLQPQEMEHIDIEGVVSNQAPPVPPIWIQSWFLPTMAVVIFVIGIVAYRQIRRIMKKPMRSSTVGVKGSSKSASS